MSLYSTAVKKPITTALIFIAIAMFGIFSFTKLPIDLYPHIESNTIMVMTTYPGASASDIENNITKPLENQLNSVSYLKHITSTSKENVSVVSLEFQYGRDLDVATNDIRDKLEMIKSYLPDEANSPVIFKFGSDDIPIMFLDVTARESLPGLYKIIDDKVVNELARVDGVGSVSMVGLAQREIKILCDPEKLDAYNLSIEGISQIIAAENQNIPLGSIEYGSNTFSVRVEKEFVDAAEIENIIVSSHDGRNVYLKDVARVNDGLQERSQESFIDGEKGGMIIVQKQTGENAVAISKQVMKKLPELQKNLPSDINIGVIVDTSDNIRKTIGSLERTILTTLLIVMVVVFLFLGKWKATIIIVLTIPVSLLASLVYLSITGNTLNIISMSSLSIAIGMVVDAAIVVLENINTHIDRGSSPKQAAVYATNEVAMAVVASSLTTIAVFFPLTLVSGLSGIMFRQLGWMVTIIITISTLCALALTPMMCSMMLDSKKESHDSKLYQMIFYPVNKAIEWISKGYAKVLDWAIRHRKTVVAIGLGFLVAVGVLALPNLKTEFIPSQDQSRISVQIQLPTGTRQEITRNFAMKIYNRFIAEFPEIEKAGFSEGVADTDNMFASMQTNGSNIINFNMRLCPMNKRSKSQDEIADDMMALLKTYPEIKKFNVTSGGQGGFGGQQSTVIEIYGYSFESTDKFAAQVADQFRQIEGVNQVVISREEYIPEYKVNLDRVKVAMNGLTTATVATYLRNRINGNVASKFREDGEEYDIRVRYAPEFRQSISAIENIVVFNSQGQPIRIRELGTVEESMTPPSITRKDRERYVSVTAPLPKGMAASDLNDGIVERINNNLEKPSDITWKIGGTYDDQKDTFKDLTTLMIMIVLLIFIVMAAQFESLTYPFVIMFAIPFAFAGVLMGLTITVTPLSIMAMIGMIMTSGIVVNNGIVLLDYANLNRERGMGITRAVVDSGHSRLRPVLMTTLTTVFGMLPLALGRGEGSELWRGMGMAIVWGLSISTLVTLIFVPVLYALFAGRGIKRERRVLVKNRERREEKIARALAQQKELAEKEKNN